MAARFVLHHHPHSRAQRIKWLLEETGAPYEIVSHNLEAGSHKRPDFLKLNPDGKLPTLIDRGPDGASEVVVTESAAILIHVADCYPDAGLAPAPGSVERGPYLTWITYASAAMEPAFADVMFPRAQQASPGAIGWPSFDATIARVADGFEPGPWLLGDRFTAADLMVGSLLGWLKAWGKLPEAERFAGLFERIAARPAHQRAFAA